jgi:hypothetical protein
MNNTQPGVEGTVSPAVDITKIVAERVKAAREKDRAELAKAMGHDSWDAMVNSGLNKKLLDAGIDPDAGKPIIDDLVAAHPDVVKAKQILQAQEEAKRLADVQTVNETFGTQFDSADAADDNVKELVSKGLSFEQAYAAVHYRSLIGGQKPSAQPNLSGTLNHLTATPGGSARTAGNDLTEAEIANVRRYIPGATIEQIKKFKAEHKL